MSNPQTALPKSLFDAIQEHEAAVESLTLGRVIGTKVDEHGLIVSMDLDADYEKLYSMLFGESHER